jgi:hypothetical protein
MDMDQFVHHVTILLTELPLSDWPPLIYVGILIYLIVFGFVCGYSVVIEKFEPTRGSSVLDLISVTLLMAASWPIWIVPMLAFALIAKIRR